VARKLYVGNLPYTVTEEQLRTLFSEVGEIADVALITDRDTGRSKGFGFVEMETDEAAQEAINRFNGYTLDNRDLTVNEARPREEGGGGGRRDNRRYDNNRGGGGRGRY
jgi:cold-inducible RNA-binding protein